MAGLGTALAVDEQIPLRGFPLWSKFSCPHGKRKTALWRFRFVFEAPSIQFSNNFVLDLKRLANLNKAD
jgi:hypothetical protein